MVQPTLSLGEVVAHLHDAKQPVVVRTRAVFGLKALGTLESIKALEHALLTDPSSLMRHEIAYVLGQMGAKSALSTLEKVLNNSEEDVIVRHEAAEAMGAIGDKSSVSILQKYADGPAVAQEIRETCVLALQRIQYDGDKAAKVYTSVDPAPPAAENDVPTLRDTLCDRKKSMFERYRAMFALRNIGGADASRALCDGMEGETDSALFRHEVAYVLGQLQHPESVPTLTKFLKNQEEHEMVRHEAAEALGSIGGPDVERTLSDFRRDERRVVRESVEVALDISDYAASDNLHYADTI